MASAAEGDTLIKNISRLRLKESDRIESTAALLRAIGASVTETEDGLRIKGNPDALHGGKVDSMNDHRIAMAAAVASLRCENPVIIRQAEAVNKSYPEFFNDFNKLGGKAHVM